MDLLNPAKAPHFLPAKRKIVAAGAAALGAAESVFIIDATTGAQTLTLPSAALWGAGHTARLLLRRIDATANVVTIQRAGADTIDGVASIKLEPKSETELIVDGTTAWFSRPASIAAGSGSGAHELNAVDYGVVADQFNNTSGFTDNVLAVKDWFADIVAQQKMGTFSGGVGLSSVANLPIVVPENPTAFTLEGQNPASSWFFLQNQFDDFFLRFLTRGGIYTGYQIRNFVDGYAAPPPFEYSIIRIANVAFFGRGTDEAGNRTLKQRGVAFVGRHDCVSLEHVEFQNFDGTALHMGYWDADAKPDSGRGGYRESAHERVVVKRCGSVVDPAWRISGVGKTWGPNISFFNDCECSLSRSDGILIENWTEDNEIHVLFFNGLKMHGTGEHDPGDDSSHIGGTSRTALTIQGSSEKNIEIRGFYCTQHAVEVGEYAIKIAGTPKKGAVRAATVVGGVYTWATSFDNGSVVDGVTITAGNSILIKDLPLADWDKHGVWVVPTSGPPTVRRTDFDTGDEFPYWAIPVTEGTVNAGSHWVYQGHNPPLVGTDDLIFGFVKVGYPQNVLLEGALNIANNGILIEGGGGHRIKLLHTHNIEDSLVTLGNGIDGPVYLDMPMHAEHKITCAAIACPFVKLINTFLKDSPALWATYHNLPKFEREPSTGTSLKTTDDLTLFIGAGVKIQFVYAVRYETLPAADFKFGINTPAVSGVDIVKRVRAPGATDWTVTNATSLPNGEAVLGTGGYGEVEISGTMTFTSAGDLRFQFAQNTIAGVPADTAVLKGSRLEVKKLTV